MKSVLIKCICASSLVLSPSWSYAVETNVGAAAQSQPKVTPDKGVETTAGSSGPSVKDSADKSGSANQGAQATQFLTGATMFAMAATQYASQNYSMAAMLTGFGILSMMQGNEHGSAAGSSGLTSFQSDGYGSAYDYGNIDLNDPNNPLANDPSIKAIGNNKKTIIDGGLLDPKTGIIKTPDGKTYKASDFASAASMEAAGFPKGAILGAMDAYDRAHKRAAAKAEKLKLGAMTASSGYEEGGGGGGGFGVGTSSDDSSGYAGSGLGGGSGSGLSLTRDPSSMAGMQKNYNGEPIGVAADSIFLMMTRRYKVKESQESFYTDAELALQK